MKTIQDLFDGLETVRFEDVRVGDVICQRHWDEDSLVLREGKVGSTYGNRVFSVGGKLLALRELGAVYLIQRAPLEEPTDAGAMVWVKYKDANYVFIRMLETDKFPWLVFHYRRDLKGLYISKLKYAQWMDWGEISQYDPKPYQWGQEL